MNELHKAFTVLGLEPGAPFETIKRRYRRLALVWHPDRMTNAEAKREAEEELKKINNSFDKLKKHFETEHKSGPSCRCQPAAAGPPPNNNTHSGPDPRRQQEEAERKRNAERARQASEAEAARKRNEERQRQAAAEEAAQRAVEAARRTQEKQRVADEAIKAEALRKEEVTRWKCTAAVALVFIGLVLYCWVGCAVRDAAHAIGQQWENFQSQFKPKEQSQPSEQQPAIQPSQPYVPPYIPPYERFPGGNPTSWMQFHNEQEQRQKLEEENQRKQDIYFANLQVDRAQKAIDHCSHDIAQIELKLLDPTISDFEKNKIRDFRDFQQRNLDAAQAELRDAQSKLASLDNPSSFEQPIEPQSSS